MGKKNKKEKKGQGKAKTDQKAEKKAEKRSKKELAEKGEVIAYKFNRSSHSSQCLTNSHSIFTV